MIRCRQALLPAVRARAGATTKSTPLRRALATEYNEPPDGLFGEPAEGRVWEDWETTTYAAYAAAGVIIVFGLSYAPRTSIKAWAR